MNKPESGLSKKKNRSARTRGAAMEIERPVKMPASSVSGASVGSSTGTARAPAVVPQPVVNDVVDGRSPVTLPSIPDENLGLLPSRYDVDRVYVLPRDPERVFATWELSSATREMASPFELAIHFLFENQDSKVSLFDCISADSYRYYCPVPEGMTAVTAQVGLMQPDGFMPVATSGRVGLALAVVRPGEPVFVSVDRDAPLGVGRRAFRAVDAPFDLPDSQTSVSGGQSPDPHSQIVEMPVSGRK